VTIHISSGTDSAPVAFRTVGKAVEAPVEMVDASANLVSALRSLLSDAVTFYLRAHGYHWNVIGPDFAEYHSLFGAVYSDVYESVDPIAENIRKLDGMAPFRLPELMALRTIVDTPVASPLPAVMALDLHSGNESVLASLRMAFDAAVAANEQGIANFISERIDAHQKHAWMLKASVSTVA